MLRRHAANVFGLFDTYQTERSFVSFFFPPPLRIPLSPSFPTMVGRHISDDLKQMALSMSLQGLRDSDIHEYMGISVRSLKRLRSTFRETGGDVSRKPISTGRPHILTSMDRKVRLTMLLKALSHLTKILVPL
jgi:hypothetical protein